MRSEIARAHVRRPSERQLVRESLSLSGTEKEKSERERERRGEFSGSS